MIGVDTNILVRFITQDDHKQTKIVNDFFEKVEIQGISVWISLINLCELVWVLESCYKIDKQGICKSIDGLLKVPQMCIENEPIVRQALTLYRNTPRTDLSDCLIGVLNKNNHCSHTVTFDKQAARLHSFELLE